MPTQPTTPDRSAEPLTEHFDSRGAALRVDRERGVIRGVKILGRESRNGRLYPAATLERSATLYEGARVNVNHPAGAAARQYEDRIGSVQDVAARDDGLFGDFHFNPKHRLAEQLLWDAEHAPQNVGFSHSVLARTSRRDGRTIVEEIARVDSVDLVADPATTQGLFESTAPGGEDAAALRQRVESLEAENRTVREELSAAQHRCETFEHRRRVDRLIEAAHLPHELDTEIFREQCYAAADDATLERLIDARREDARLLEQRRPQSKEQRPDGAFGEKLDAVGFAAALR